MLDMIIDGHQHFWNKDKFNYAWLTPDLKCLYRNFMPQDLKPLTETVDVKKTVVVQAMSSLEETIWLLQLSEENDFIGGVVGWVDLQDDHLESVLDTLIKYPKLKSMRHQVEDEKNSEWLLQKKVINGLKNVAKFGLGFDALVKYDQLWQLSRVLESCPDLKIVIDHAAKPHISRKQFDDCWADNIRQASKLPVYCKLSGLFTEVDHENWSLQEILPYSDYILETFGVDKVIFGSDWPVSTMALDYARTVKISLRLYQNLSEREKGKIFYKNAEEFYRI